MLTPSDITLQLQKTLPLLTDRFHDSLPVTSAVVSSGILTITFPENHNLEVGNQIMINDVWIKNRISNIITNADDTISYFTANEHDLTAYYSLGHKNIWPDGLTVEILVDSIFYTVDLVPDPSGIPNKFEFVGIKNSPVFPITGNEYLLENRTLGVLGFQTITAKTDLTIEIDLSNVPSIPDGPLIMSKILTNVRVCTVVNAERAEEIYTSQVPGKDYCFVIMLDREASNDRMNDDDFVSLPGSSLKMLNIRQQFSTLIISPTDNDLGASEIKSLIYTTIFTILLKCLYGWESTGYISDGDSVYNTAYYGHSFDWETRQRITFEDGFLNNGNVAFRRLEFTQTIFDEGESSGSIDL